MPHSDTRPTDTTEPSELAVYHALSEIPNGWELNLDYLYVKGEPTIPMAEFQLLDEEYDGIIASVGVRPDRNLSADDVAQLVSNMDDDDEAFRVQAVPGAPIRDEPLERLGHLTKLSNTDDGRTHYVSTGTDFASAINEAADICKVIGNLWTEQKLHLV